MIKKKEAGFTLLEILAVVAIIGVLAAFIVPKVAESVTEARNNACVANIKYLEGLIERYRLARGSYPQNLGQLNTWYQGEYPVCPKPAAPLVGKETGYYFNKDTGKVTTSGAELTKIENP
jgi:prepilin-type N-terminal cleavage/methylation domain-containing protein